MVLSELTFEVNKNVFLKEEDKETLIEAYRLYFIKLYGFNIFDAFLKVTNEDATKVKDKLNCDSETSENLLLAKKIIDDIQENDNYELLLIYSDANLIAGGRINKIDDKTASLLEIAVTKEHLDIEKDIYKLAIEYIEKYLKDLDFRKMYLETPLKDAKLLKLGYDLGFKEDPADIDISKEVYTYVLNKKLER